MSLIYKMLVTLKVYQFMSYRSMMDTYNTKRLAVVDLRILASRVFDVQYVGPPAGSVGRGNAAVASGRPAPAGKLGLHVQDELLPVHEHWGK